MCSLLSFPILKIWPHLFHYAPLPLNTSVTISQEQIILLDNHSKIIKLRKFIINILLSSKWQSIVHIPIVPMVTFHIIFPSSPGLRIAFSCLVCLVSYAVPHYIASPCSIWKKCSSAWISLIIRFRLCRLIQFHT